MTSSRPLPPSAAEGSISGLGSARLFRITTSLSPAKNAGLSSRKLSIPLWAWLSWLTTSAHRLPVALPSDGLRFLRRGSSERSGGPGSSA